MGVILLGASFTHVSLCRTILTAYTSYKAAGVQFLDDQGTRDVTEFINVSKDDALAWPGMAHRTYPSTVNARMETTIKPFVEKSLAINNFVISILNEKLGLPKGTLASFHNPWEHSGCVARVIRAPPYPNQDEKTFLTAHTDFGSLVSTVNLPMHEHLPTSLLSVVPPQPSGRLTSPPS